jgi:hypothetical protein
MVKINKSLLPPGACIRNERDYRDGDIFDLLVKDCRNKCYICEDKAPTALNVEHRIPHKGDSALKYDCANLKNKIMKEITHFRQYVNGYKDEPNIGYADIISEELSRGNAFAAFKRGIVRNDPEIARAFFEALL